jgi:hypothetical protein
MAKAKPKKGVHSQTLATEPDDFAVVARDFVKALNSVDEDLRPLRHTEEIADNLGRLATALDGLSNAMAMSVIAQYGTDRDREAAVAYLKRWFEGEFRY